MKAVVLAAGLGKRMRPYTDECPKAMLPLADRRVIDFILEDLIKTTDTVVVVTGYRGELLREYLCRGYDRRVLTVHNPEYHKGSIVTVLKARELLSSEPFIITNGDHIFEAGFFQSFIERATLYDSVAAVACHFHREVKDDEMKVTVSDRGKLLQIDKKLTGFHGAYIGATLVLKPEVYWQKAQKVAEDPQANVEEVLKHLPVQTIGMDDFRFVEIDFPEEYQFATESIWQLRGS